VPWRWIAKGEKFVQVAAEQRALADAKAMRQRGKSWNEIGEYFASKRLKPRSGGEWFPATVRQVLNSRMVVETVG
jgi:hypothetical protein